VSGLNDDKKDISLERLKALEQLTNKYDAFYRNPKMLTISARENMWDDLMREYIPSALHELPFLLNKIRTMKSVIDKLEKDKIELIKQRNKAYIKLDWKINKFYDAAEDEDYFIYKEKQNGSSDL
jgi:hypothetical protein